MIGGGCVSGVSVERVCDWWRVLCECCGWVWRGYVIGGGCYVSAVGGCGEGM